MKYSECKKCVLLARELWKFGKFTDYQLRNSKEVFSLKNTTKQ